MKFPNQLSKKRITKVENGEIISDYFEINVCTPNGKDQLDLFIVQAKDVKNLIDMLSEPFDTSNPLT